MSKVEHLERHVDDLRLILAMKQDEIERLREALEYCACTCAKSCGKHIEHDGEIAFVECSGWVARSALQKKDSE